MIFPSSRTLLFALVAVLPALAARVRVIGKDTVNFHGAKGEKTIWFDLNKDGSVNMASKSLSPWWNTWVVSEDQGPKNNMGGGDLRGDIVVARPKCHFDGHLKGEGAVTFWFSPKEDYLFPCHAIDPKRGTLRIVCEGPEAKCLNVPPPGA